MKAKHTPEPYEANARLIAAAPELLQIAKTVRWAIKYGLDKELKSYAKAWGRLLIAVENAINRVEGGQ